MSFLCFELLWSIGSVRVNFAQFGLRVNDRGLECYRISPDQQKGHKQEKVWLRMNIRQCCKHTDHRVVSVDLLEIHAS
jgi:hypothetical protein